MALEWIFVNLWNKRLSPRNGYVENLCYEFVREGRSLQLGFGNVQRV